MKKSTLSFEASHCPDARSLAVQVLLHVKPSIPLQASLDTGLRNTSLQHKDHALCTELVYGTMRYSIRIDAALDVLMKKRSALPDEMQCILRVSAYALLFLDRVPHHATVNWAVNLIKTRFGLGLSKVANGTLRSLSRLGDEPHQQNFYKNSHEYFSVPLWLYKLFVQSYGQEDAERILLRSLDRPKIALRLNARHNKFDELKAFFENEPQDEARLDVHEENTCFEDSAAYKVEPVGWTGFVFTQGNTAREALGQSMFKLHDSGAFSWQAAGSQHVLKLCFDNVPDLKFSPMWDACAGQGGKSLALIEQGLEIALASDTSKNRLMLLRETAHRLKLACPEVVCSSAANPPIDQWQGNILLDVPCTGFGTLARRPEIRLHRSQNDMLNLVALQKKILRAAFAVLQAQQFIVYMTCTLNPLENEKLIEKFLLDNTSAELKFTWQTPHDHPYLEGMYVAVLQKK